MRTTIRAGTLLLCGLAAGLVAGGGQVRARQMGPRHEMMQRDMNHMHEMMPRMERIMERVHRLSERMPSGGAQPRGAAPMPEDPVRQMSRSVMIMAVEMKSAVDACDRMTRDPALTKDRETLEDVRRLHEDLMSMADRMERTLGILEGLIDESSPVPVETEGE